MTLICGTTLEIPFIPTEPVETLLANAEGIEVFQIATSGMDASAIDTAVLKILTRGDRAAGLGITRLDPAAMAAHPEPETVCILKLPVGLVNFANEMPHYAAYHYGAPEDLDPIEAIVHVICHGELDLQSEIFIDEDYLEPLSRHEEIARRAAITAAHAAQRAPAPAAA